MPSERQLRKIAYRIQVPLSAVSAFNAVLARWLKSTHLLPIYLSVPYKGIVRATAETGGAGIDGMQVKMSPQGIISSARATYGHLGVVFSVVSEKPNRILICASLSSETTPLVKEASPTGQPST